MTDKPIYNSTNIIFVACSAADEVPCTKNECPDNNSQDTDGKRRVEKSAILQ